MRQKKNHWKSWEQVEEAIRRSMKKLGRFPTERDLKRLKKSDLLYGIRRFHGGLPSVRQKMGFKLPKKPRFYWQSWQAVVEVLQPIIVELGRFPKQQELITRHRTDVLNGIFLFHGGLKGVRERMEHESPSRT